MKVAVDTNVLVRSVVRDEDEQARVADEILRSASLIAVAIPVLCEFVWVLRKVYDFGLSDIALALQTLLRADNVVVDRTSAEAGLSILESGGDFADGVIAHEGLRLGGETFVSFDRKAAALLKKQGQSAIHLKVQVQ